jgi:RNA polymerase sigma factor (sigma-70 family)
MTPASVFIVDDDPGVRDSLAMLLELKGFHTRTYDSAEQFLARYRPEWPGCLVLDLRMAGMGGLALQAELARRGVRLPIIIVTAHGDVAAARTALRAGAVDFIEKPIDNELLLAAITGALEHDARSRDHAATQAGIAERLARLTAREREVLEMVVEGRHNREIAAALAISPRTVEVYKSRLMEKLQVRRVPELVKLVLEARRASDGPAPA